MKRGRGGTYSNGIHRLMIIPNFEICCSVGAVNSLSVVSVVSERLTDTSPRTLVLHRGASVCTQVVLVYFIEFTVLSLDCLNV